MKDTQSKYEKGVNLMLQSLFHQSAAAYITAFAAAAGVMLFGGNELARRCAERLMRRFVRQA